MATLISTIPYYISNASPETIYISISINAVIYLPSIYNTFAQKNNLSTPGSLGITIVNLSNSTIQVYADNVRVKSLIANETGIFNASLGSWSVLASTYNGPVGLNNANNNVISNVAPPVASTDVATKGYVDGAVGGDGA